ncbi:macrolide-specific efflux system membrane fusion protein [Streptacidiphilus sp. MAP12-16]|uniref:efflux RND transporter periplasmic adaptor subunit n=1 Tax=Streptacidiphilus sp. MAP12-16 TaxID=3156300 RepID=UPI0035195192
MKVLPQRRRAALLNPALAVLLVAGSGAAYAAVKTSTSSSASKSNTTTYTVAKGLVLATVGGTGSLYSPSDAGVNFATGGTVTQVNVQPGSKVTKGEVLAKVDPTAANETLSTAQAKLTAAQANLTQVENPTATSSNGVTSTPTVNASELTSAQAQVTAAQNSVTAAQAAVAGTVLTAPISGTVNSVTGKVGDAVSSGSSSTSSSTPSGFVVIANPGGMEVSADFAEADALKVKAGQSASVTLNAGTSTELNAKVLSISSLPASSSGSAVTYAAVLAITSDTSSLRTGLSATVSVLTGEADNALYLPTAALTGTGTTRTATVVEANGTTRTQSVTVGLAGDSDVQIASGLTEGQKVQVTTVATTGGSGGGFGGGAGGFGGAGRGGTGGGGGGGGRG